MSFPHFRTSHPGDRGSGPVHEPTSPSSCCHVVGSQRSRGKRVCMITYSYYESDHRVIRYAEALALRGDDVDVLALRRSADLPAEQTINGVHLHRVQDRFDKAKANRWAYLCPTLRFMLTSSLWMMRRYSRTCCDVVHVHNIPD